MCIFVNMSIVFLKNYVLTVLEKFYSSGVPFTQILQILIDKSNNSHYEYSLKKYWVRFEKYEGPNSDILNMNGM